MSADNSRGLLFHFVWPSPKQVVLWDINHAALEAVAQKIQDIDPECKVVTEAVDVTNRELVYVGWQSDGTHELRVQL